MSIRHDYDQQLSANILVIGKSGVGKSSLLNYIFGAKVEETGSGAPVTKKGIYDHTYTYDQNFQIHIFDTWGLEADKAEEWKTMLMDKMQEYDQKEIHEWFNTIIFCTSVDANRFEDFEIEMIRDLRKAKNNIIVAVTHCHSPNDEKAIQLRDERICKKTGLTEEDVVFVSSVEKKLISGAKTECFGKERIFELIIRNLWRTFKEKLPYRVTQKVKDALAEYGDKLHEIIHSNIHFFAWFRKKNLDKVEGEINTQVNHMIPNITQMINDDYEDAYRYYDALSRKYCSVGMYLDAEKLRRNPRMKFESRSEFKEKAKEQLVMISNKLNAKWDRNGKLWQRTENFLVKIRTDFSSIKEVRETLETSAQKLMDDCTVLFEQELQEIESYINSLDIEKNYIISQTRNRV